MNTGIFLNVICNEAFFFAGEARKLADGERKKGRLIHLLCELSAAPYLRYLSTFVSSCQILTEIQVVCNKAKAAN